MPGHGCLHRGFPFYVLPVPLEDGAAGSVGGGFEFADGGRHGFSPGSFGWRVFERGWVELLGGGLGSGPGGSDEA